MSGSSDAASDSGGLTCMSLRALKSSFDMYSPLRGEELPSAVSSCHPAVYDLGLQRHLGIPAEKLADVTLVEPDVLQRLHVDVAGEGLAQGNAVDAAGRRATDDVDAHRQLGAAGRVDAMQCIEIGGFGLRVGERVVVGIFVECSCCADQFVQLFGDPVHVHRERHPAVADQSQP